MASLTNGKRRRRPAVEPVLYGYYAVAKEAIPLRLGLPTTRDPGGRLVVPLDGELPPVGITLADFAVLVVGTRTERGTRAEFRGAGVDELRQAKAELDRRLADVRLRSAGKAEQ